MPETEQAIKFKRVVNELINGTPHAKLKASQRLPDCFYPKLCS